MALVMALILGSAGASATGSTQAAQAPVPVPPHRSGPHIMPIVSPRPASGPAPLAAAAPAGAHLSYFGGRVLSNIKVVQVIYGSGTYLPQTLAATSPSVSTFFGGVTNSPYVDWLTEYNTNITAQGGQAGTNQTIGRGTFGGRFIITPSPANNGATIQDSNVQSELRTQITAGQLPAPDANTLYSVFFRNGQSICSGTSCSLVAGGFCAYHSTIPAALLPEIFYSVHPDLSSTNLCGPGTPFQNTTSVVSHEMIETVTDPEVGVATTFGPPLGWYDQPNNQEIGDLCNGQQGTVTGGDGVIYTVQLEFSNRANACIVTRLTYSLAVLADSPVDYWRLNDTTSTVHDTIGAKEGTYVATSPSRPNPALPVSIPGATPSDAGNVGKLLGTFDTPVAISVAGSPGASIVGDSTLEAWFTIPMNLGTDSANSMFGSATLGSGTWGAIQWFGAPGSVTLQYLGGRANLSAVMAFTPTGPQAWRVWHHLALTISGSVATVYIDGQAATSGSARPSTQPSGPALIGTDGQDMLLGGLQDVAIYNRALTPAQIATHISAAA